MLYPSGEEGNYCRTSVGDFCLRRNGPRVVLGCRLSAVVLHLRCMVRSDSLGSNLRAKPLLSSPGDFDVQQSWESLSWDRVSESAPQHRPESLFTLQKPGPHPESSILWLWGVALDLTCILTGSKVLRVPLSHTLRTNLEGPGSAYIFIGAQLRVGGENRYHQPPVFPGPTALKAEGEAAHSFILCLVFTHWENEEVHVTSFRGHVNGPILTRPGVAILV